MRERGLKESSGERKDEIARRSREGAWIESLLNLVQEGGATGRSREGAWIERKHRLNALKCSTCRSREGAWIER